MVDLTDVDADSRTGSFKGGHEMLINSYKGAMSETNDTKNGAGTSKQIKSQYNLDHLNVAGSYQQSSHGPANNQSAEHDYSNDEFEGDQHNGDYQSIEQHSLNKDSSMRGGYGEFRRKAGKRSATTKDAKILNTMKAYLPQLVPKKHVSHKIARSNQHPPRIIRNTSTEQQDEPTIESQPQQMIVRSVTRGSQQAQNEKAQRQRSERIIFVEDRRQHLSVNQAVGGERKGSVNMSTVQLPIEHQIMGNQSRKNTQLPPINSRQASSNIQVLDSKQNPSPKVSRANILSPLSSNNMIDDNLVIFAASKAPTQKQQVQGPGYSSSFAPPHHQPPNSEKRSVNKTVKTLLQAPPMLAQFTQGSDQSPVDLGEEGDFDYGNENAGPRQDFKRKNLEIIQKMQEKKLLEQKMIEEERQKMIRKQEKLKLLVLKQAAEIREKRQKELEEQERRRQEEEANKEKTPVKKKKPYQPPAHLYQPAKPAVEKKEGNIEEVLNQEEDEEKKQQKEMMKKYYRNRYHSFLKALIDQNKKRENDIEEQKAKEEKRKNKLKENLGIVNIQSRLFEDKPKEVILEEIQPKLQPQKRKEQLSKRGSSLAPMKSNSSTVNFNRTTKEEDSNVSTTTDSQLSQIYISQNQLKSVKSERTKSKSDKRARTPKAKENKRIIIMPIDERNEEELEKEIKAKREAAEKIKKRQEKYMQEIQAKREKEATNAEEERKKKEKLKQMAREQVKQIFDKVNNQPGLKEQQEKELKGDEESDDEEGEDEERSKKKKKPAQVIAQQDSNMDAFLQRNKPQQHVFPNITDLATWKKKFKVDDNVKVFICTGGYPDIKKALKKRGWVHNKDPSSPCFDFKWVLKSKDIDHNILNDSQLVNHFSKAAAITTKVGLCHNLKNLIWFNNVDIDTFYPRCFDLAIQEELEDFIQEFKAVKAESYVKIFVREMRETQGAAHPNVSDKVLQVALRVCEKRLRDLDDLIDDPSAFSELVTDDEWKVLGADELTLETLAQKKHEDWMNKNEVMQAEKRKQEKLAAEKEKKKKKKKKVVKKEEDEEEDKEDEDVIDDDEDEEEKSKHDNDQDNAIAKKNPEFKRAIKILEELKKKFPQYNLNGERNIWIIKPAGSSRGRGIVLYKQLVEILDLCKQKESQFIAQKYMENSLIVKKRKFDIRQWVLVTDWNPLTVWLYNEPYFRFPASDYNPNNIADRFIHLTNNSVAKYAEGSSVSFPIDGNMLCLEEIKNLWQEEFGWDVWEDKLKEQSKNIVINCLESVQDMFECKKGCFELFGFDLMVDDDFNMWLIEVNSSPAMDYSTAVTERLVKLVLEDTVKVVVDYANAKKKSQVDTGLYECIYKAKRIVDKPMTSFGLNLVCEGKKIAQNKLSYY